MPKLPNLTKRFTIRMSEWLHDRMVKYTLDHDIDYAAFVRLAISKYLADEELKSPENQSTMSAIKNTFSDDFIPDSSMFETSEAEDTNVIPKGFFD